jgi:hypothetical protein
LYFSPRAPGVWRRVNRKTIAAAYAARWHDSDRLATGARARSYAALERHGHLKLDDGVRTNLLAASAATIDRSLREPRTANPSRRKRASAASSIRRAVPVRTFADWKEPAPGFVEADLVAHCGDSMDGGFVHTLALTDIASGWTECAPLLVREGTLVVEALSRLRTAMPFALRGFDTDNGSEFLNEIVLNYCTCERIEFTRSRAYHKNDQAWIEQKNGSVVRRMIGYRRLEGLSAVRVLARLYAASRLFVNFFQPSFKLLEKTRIGARVKKRYLPPETPCARLLGSETISSDVKERLERASSSLDPLKLLDQIRTAQHELAELAAGRSTHIVPHRDEDLDRFLASFATAWRDGEVRPTHRSDPRPPRHWRTHKDEFEGVWPKVQEWLEEKPERTARNILTQLQDEHAGEFSDRLLRTLQRRVKEWRHAAAKLLVFGGDGVSLSA